MGTRVVAGFGALALAVLLVSAPWMTSDPAGHATTEEPATHEQFTEEAAARGPMSGSGGTALAPVGTEYTWPLDPEPAVLRPFEPPEHVWSPGHRGVDLAAEAGAPVHAAGAGVVAFVGWVVDRPVVSIDHPDGIRTTYEPVDAVVAPGRMVDAGTMIGHLRPAGESHCGLADPCLHWGARIGTNHYIDPLGLLDGSPPVIRLYPILGDR